MKIISFFEDFDFDHSEPISLDREGFYDFYIYGLAWLQTICTSQADQTQNLLKLFLLLIF